MNEFDALMAESFDAMLAVSGELREIVVSDQAGGKKTIRAVVIWARDTISRPAKIPDGGVIICDALLSMWADLFDRQPVQGEFLESPPGTQWEIAMVMPSNDVCYLALNATRAV